MSNGSTQQNGAAPDGSPDALEAQVERDREKLAATVDALHDKLDVKAHVKARAERLKDQATTDSGKPSPALLGLAALAVAGVGFLAWRRAHR